jgi:hypothetical protein
MGPLRGRIEGMADDLKEPDLRAGPSRGEPFDSLRAGLTGQILLVSNNPIGARIGE